MLRFRRYRVFLVSAFIILVLLYHVGRNSNWEAPSATFPHKAKDQPTHGDKKHSNIESLRPPKYQPQDKVEPSDNSGAYRGYTPEEAEQPPKKEQVINVPTLKEDDGTYGAYALPPVTAVKSKTSTAPGPKTTKPAVDIPDRVPATPADAFDPTPTPTPPTTIHWVKPTEHFPVPSESLIRLPTGKPKPIPTIQARFAPESDAAKLKRERRLAKVKSEAERAWHGYKTYAWMHDEVKPVSKKPHDPFCGWAATLVDALDTLWIMGLESEFEDAVAAVGDIDFTTTPFRSDIPVFETIIRYLGGLLGAYDVSGSRYKVLLDKAVELAEILMGVFDTPNRMPVLYYNWKPEYASQPHRASSSASVAEMGSMSMEFTRLAQVTGEDRYYDAVARITDAFEEWQKRGTALGGIFPQNVDSSGCNRTALNELLTQAQSEAAKEQERLEAVKEEAEALGYTPRDGKDGEDEGKGDQTAKARTTKAVTPQRVPTIVGRDTHASTRGPPFKANGLPADWDCPAQPLVPAGYGSDSYSMGANQDSAYEYYPKQYLLLGGLEPKYRTMHEKTVRAVKKYLLYRPMIKDEKRELLFSAKAYSQDGTDQKLSYDYEVTHLTCFLGGMFGLGGKIFGSEEDVEVAKKLADGCVWAYEVMPKGIMPEASTMVPCKSVAECKWNETAWWDAIDPNRQWRDEQMADYLQRMKEWKEEVRNLTALAEQRKKEKKPMPGELVDDKDTRTTVEEERKLRPVNDTLPAADGSVNTLKVGDSNADETHDLRSEREGSRSVQKRTVTDASDSVLDRARTAAKTEEMVEKLGTELDFNNPSGRTAENRGYDASSSSQVFLADDELELPPEPIKPQTHEEYIKDRLENEHLLPGFVTLNDKRYILRPEAIESVWYMYRITGDPIWQEKGWRMFESVMAATSTSIGHSAIGDVSTAGPVSFNDNMESFWLAETLKYFYLLFATPDVISLDEWVFNTEAHPFRRPT